MKKWIVICALAILLIIVLIVVLRRRRARLELQQKADDKLREEALDRVLIGGQKEEKRGTVAFEVKYEQQSQRKKKNDGGSGSGHISPVMLQLTEETELSVRKYMLHAAEILTIGSGKEGNDIVITGENIEKRQCEILRIGKQLYVTNCGRRGQVLLKRGKKQMILEGDAVELQSGDVLYIGAYTYKVTILRN